MDSTVSPGHPVDGDPSSPADPVAPAPAPVASALAERLPPALAAARGRLFATQRDDGHWAHPLETDVSVTADFLLASRHLGRVDEDREERIVRYLSGRQGAEGAWRIHPSGPPMLDQTIKAYAAMRAAGVSRDDPRLRRAREHVLDAGGVEASATFTKINLAIAGAVSWDAAPCIPPEMMLLPRSAPFNIYEMSYWCRTIMVPLTIVQALRRPGHLASAGLVDDLFVSPKSRRREGPDQRGDWFSWKRLFWFLDRALKGLEPMSPKELRQRSLKAAERWILERLEGTDGLGAIHPAMLNTVHALWMLGYDWSHPALERAWNDLVALGVEDGDEYWMQPCFSPVWDTSLALLALAATDFPADDPRVERAADWLVTHRTTTRGDWSVKAPTAPACAWAFEYRNPVYPDVDDTGMVVMALERSASSRHGDRAEILDAATRWCRAMQSRNGGWGAFDRNNDRLLLQHVPFADHGALLDAPTSDLTGRALELLGCRGARRGDEAVEAGLAFLRREQEDEGSWFGRWGVNYIYGTWSVLAGLEAIGLDRSDPMIERAVAWLESIQHDDGSFGESCESYVDRSVMGRGAPTASHTAWGLLGLIAAGRGRSAAALRAARWLLDAQEVDGGWSETEWTGTGFPGVLYLRYDGYRLVFPLMALGRLARCLDEDAPEAR